MSQFGFTVKRGRADRGGGWSVFLPHRCDTWDIAGEGDEYNSLCVVGVPHAEAVAALEQFIAEAQEAMGKLVAQQEMGDE